MTDAPLDLDALEEFIFCADPTAPLDHMAIYASLRNAAPALIAAARERDELSQAAGVHWRTQIVEANLTNARAEIFLLREALEAAEPLVASHLRAREASERKTDAVANGFSGIIAHADEARDALAKVRAALGRNSREETDHA